MNAPFQEVRPLRGPNALELARGSCCRPFTRQRRMPSAPRWKKVLAGIQYGQCREEGVSRCPAERGEWIPPLTAVPERMPASLRCTGSIMSCLSSSTPTPSNPAARSSPQNSGSSDVDCTSGRTASSALVRSRILFSVGASRRARRRWWRSVAAAALRDRAGAPISRRGLQLWLREQRDFFHLSTQRGGWRFGILPWRSLWVSGRGGRRGAETRGE